LILLRGFHMLTRLEARMSFTVRIILRVPVSALVLSLALVDATAANAQLTAGPGPAATDLGQTDVSQIVSASLVLKVRHREALERAVAASEDPLSGSYHRFVSVADFTAQYAPRRKDIAAIQKYLEGFGITVTEVYADQLLLKVSGTVDAFNRVFATDMHDYEKDGRRFHCPRHAPSIPTLFRDLLLVVGGLSDEHLFHPMHVKVGSALTGLPSPAVVLPAAGSTASGVPGSYTVGDVANLYDINPLYDAHIDGRGRTLGIATLAAFHPDDAYTYWKLIGLDVLPDRITQVHVDGGGPLGADAGSGETSLDVEQSGGLAPRAKIIVYDAPNTDAGFIDVFYKAASDNLVDSLSVSWGLAEEFYYPELNGSDLRGELLAFHQAFLESAAQGMSLFASSGDSGAYDINSGFNTPFLNVLSVDSPSSDPAITAAGGTTTPYNLTLAVVGAPTLSVTTEQVWGWDYLQDYLVEVRGPAYQDALFPVGGGGGVSIFWPRPWYQARTSGIEVTASGQRIVADDGTGPQDLLDLPAGFAGRNLPDVSLDGDPESGFILYSTEDGGLISGYGGTSFVSPQLNGISALLAQSQGGRIGLWNPMLYRFHNSCDPEDSAALRDIVAGDNWYYQGVPGYEPGAGLGVLDVAKLAAAIARESASCQL
jgi:kumamolisin